MACPSLAGIYQREASPKFRRGNNRIDPSHGNSLSLLPQRRPLFACGWRLGGGGGLDLVKLGNGLGLTVGCGGPFSRDFDRH